MSKNERCKDLCQLLIRAQSGVWFHSELINQWPRPSIGLWGPAHHSTHVRQLSRAETTRRNHLNLNRSGLACLQGARTNLLRAIKYTRFPTFQGWLLCSQALVEYMSAVGHASTHTHRKQLDRWDKSVSFTSAPLHAHTHTHLCVGSRLSCVSCTVNHSTLRLGVKSTGLLSFPWSTHAHAHAQPYTQARGQGDSGLL